MVELRGVSYHVGQTPILHEIDLTIRPGRFTAILGPNGAGKSTLMRLATGLSAPTTGNVRYGKRELSSFSSAELALVRAVLSQQIEVTFPLPAIDVVMMGRYPHYGRVPSAADHEVVRQAIDLVGMDHKQLQSYATLSGGERQKVQLARVLAQIWPYDRSPGAEHKMLFLDEPTSSLDVHFQLHLLDAARTLLNHDCTVVAILHDLNLAFAYGDDFVLLDAGRVALAAEDIPADTIERVFQVRARRVDETDDRAPLWRFRL